MRATIHPPIRFAKDVHKQRLARHLESRISRGELQQRWEAVLQSATAEKPMQQFLERFPELLPGLEDKHNGPRRGIIVSQFRFGSDYTADFAFVSTNSMELQFTFVEIEDPSRNIFNADDSFSQHFHHALQQVRDWLRWSASNMDHLLHMYGDLFYSYNVTNDLRTARGYLVYGRREEIEQSQRRRERWSSLALEAHRSIHVMTYDRLSGMFDMRSSETIFRNYAVCSYKQRGFVFRPSSVAR